MLPPAGTLFTTSTTRLAAGPHVGQTPDHRREDRHAPYGEVGGVFDRNGTPLTESSIDFRLTGIAATTRRASCTSGHAGTTRRSGLFVSQDPAAQFPSPYAYAGGNPLGGQDPTGTFFGFEAILVGIVLGAVIGAVVTGIQRA